MEGFQIPNLPTFSDEELEVIRSMHERQLLDLARAAGLKGGLAEARERFTKDIPPFDVLSPRSVGHKWLGVPPGSEDALEEAVEGFYAHYFEGPKARGMPDPGSYATTQMMMDFTAQRLASLGRLKGPKPLAANIPRGDIRAVIQKMPATGRAIMFYPSGQYIFMGDIAKVISFFFRPMTAENIRTDRALADTATLGPIYPGFAKWLSQALCAVTVEEHPIRVNRIQVSREQGFLSMHLFNFSQMFVFAHEIAHQELGHLESDDLGPERVMADEYAADRFAVEAVCEVSKYDYGSWALGFWGCQLALLSFEMLHNTLKIFDRRPSDAPWLSMYYPTIGDRRRAIQRVAMDVADRDGMDAATNVTNLTCKVLNALQSHVDLELLAIRSILKDVKVAPVWRSYIDENFGPKPEDQNHGR